MQQSTCRKLTGNGAQRSGVICSGSHLHPASYWTTAPFTVFALFLFVLWRGTPATAAPCGQRVLRRVAGDGVALCVRRLSDRLVPAAAPRELPISRLEILTGEELRNGRSVSHIGDELLHLPSEVCEETTVEAASW